MKARCAAAAVAVAAALGAAESAPAATKWLCGPGVAHDPCRPSLSTTLLPRLGRPHRGRHAAARPRPRRRLLLRLPDGLRPADPAGDQARRPGDPLDRALPGRALLAALPRVRACLPAGDRPGAAGREDDARGLPHGLRRRREGVRRVPAPHRPAPRLRPPRPLAGELPPAAAHPPPHRQPSRRAPPARLGRAARRQRHRPRESRTAAARSAACRPAGGRRSSPA